MLPSTNVNVGVPATVTARVKATVMTISSSGP